MRGLAIFISTLISLSGCNNGKEYPPEVDFGGEACIRVIVQDDLDSVRMDINHGSYFPIQSCLIHRFTLTRKRTCEASYHITRPELVWFEFRDTVCTSYMRPGDTPVASDFRLTSLQEIYIDDRKSQSLKKLEKLEDENRLKPGSEAPCFYLKDPSGVFHTLSDYRGKLIYLHFRATWCGPCLEEIPSLNKLAENLSGRPVEIINICLDD